MLPIGKAELLADIEGLPVLVRLLVQDVPAEMQSHSVYEGADVNPRLSSTLEKMVERMGGFPLRRDDPSKQPRAIVEVISSGESLVQLPAPPKETVLRVGPLELDLLDRTARRGDRQIDLRPREFRLLKYMMQRSDKLLTRATLLKEVWHYKFVPETNLVDVHMGRLRRKVDGSNEAPMIRNVRGVGFVLSAAPLSQDSPSRDGERPGNLVLRDRWKERCNDIRHRLPAAPATDGQHHLASGHAITGKTSWNRAPFLPSDSAESLPS
jgi:DNA-binding winged helix-turn-helix (wHTH) protein